MNQYNPELTGKVIIVTGGTSGIGKESVKKFVSLNATVVFTGRSQEKADSVIGEIISQGYPKDKAIFYQCNFDKFKEVEGFASYFNLNYSRLDVLLNNAGVLNANRIMTKDGLEMTLQCNYYSPFQLTAQLYPLQAKTEQSRIINVSSLQHSYAYGVNETDFAMLNQKYSMFGHYNESKFMNVLFTHGLKVYNERHKQNLTMKSASLHPGCMITDIVRDFTNKFIKSVAQLLFMYVGVTEEEGSQTQNYQSQCPFDKIIDGEYYERCSPEISKKSSLVTDKNAVKAWNLTIDLLNTKASAPINFEYL